MKLQYLGTAAAEAIPALFCNCEYCLQARQTKGKDWRTRSQAVIDRRLLIDFPADTFGHVKDYDLPLESIQNILITHTHQDHLYLEDLGLRFEAFCHKIKGTLTLYGNRTLVEKYQKMYCQNPEDHHLEGYLAVQELKPFQKNQIDGYHVWALPADHDSREQCFIYLIEHNGRRLLYGNDSGWFPSETWDFLEQTKLHLVSLDCTHLKYKAGRNHLGIPDVLKVKEELLRRGCICEDTQYVATHFSHNGHMLHDEAVRALAPHGVQIAYDGFTVTV